MPLFSGKGRQNFVFTRVGLEWTRGREEPTYVHEILSIVVGWVRLLDAFFRKKNLWVKRRTNTRDDSKPRCPVSERLY